MQTLAIAGVGLIGGSIGLALRKAGFKGRIIGVSSPATIEQAKQVGAIDEGATIEEAAATADVLYLAQPISVILEVLGRLSGLVRTDCLVTDAGSTKVQITEAAKSIPLFVGGHPMAGKEARGVSAADPDLFRGRPYVFTATECDRQVRKLQEFIHWMSRCGAVPIFLSAQDHDRIVAFTSHLPQLAATALACTLGTQLHSSKELAVSGPGLRDATRLALSPWDVWRDIVGSNTENIQHALAVYIDKLTEVRDNLQTQRTGDQFAFAADVAAKMRR